MFELRPYQKEISKQAKKILLKKRIVYLAMMVRTGKTFTSFAVANDIFENVLFITKKKAISSIQSDYDTMKPSFDLTVINYESVHKVGNNFDCIIIDEAHSLGAFPKPSKRTKAIKEIVSKKDVILLSGTPTPETWSQIYHQFWISFFSPFKESSFYKWSKTYVDVKKKYVAHGNMVNDYSNAHQKIIYNVIKPYMITLSQKEAGFTSKVNENILEVKMKPSTYHLIDILERDKVYEGKKGGVILGDTPVKLMQKVHQLYSGTIKLEDGSSKITDVSKGEFIKKYFDSYKIAIFYKFKEEYNLLKKVFGDNITNQIKEFKTTSKNIALQIVSGREGISLKEADFLVFYNIDFSATSYWQARDRLTTKERSNNTVFWVFAKGGLEHSIYRTVMDKKNYTSKHYDRSKISK